MREIKFRIVYKNKINGYERLTEKGGNIFWEWMAIDMNPDNGSERWCSGVFPKDFAYKRNQFTGLKDKNGKEIYEGDILKMVCKGDKRNGQIMHNFVDYFSGGTHCGFRLRNKSYANNLTGNRIYNGEMEVIGNIYENPELVTPK